MSKYFFFVDDGVRLTSDEIGMDLRSFRYVETEVVLLLTDMIHLRMPGGGHMVSVTFRGEHDMAIYHGEMTVTGRRFRK